MAQVLGVVQIFWRGEEIPVETGATYRPAGMTQAPVSYGRRSGYAQTFAQGQCTATTNLERGQSLDELLARGEGELQVICDTGQTWVHADAFLSGEMPDVTGGEGGKIPLTWSFGEGEEILA